MSSLRKLERDRSLAELASMEALIGSLTDEDAMARLSLEERRDELRREVAELQEFEEHTASAALFFGGKPVIGQRGVESEFAGTAVTKFQDLVSKLMVHQVGELGQRGPVPNKAASIMHITNVVRGSFGFVLEEMQTQGQLIDTALQSAVDDASRLMSAFAGEDEESFQSAAEEADERILATAGELFGLLRDSGATMRLVVGEHDEAFGSAAVERAALRAASTTITEDVENIEGQLAGALPDGHMFEFRRSTGNVIRGRVDKSVTSEQLMQWNLTMLSVDAIARAKVRRVYKDGSIVREGFTLLGLERTGEQQLQIEEDRG